MKRRILRRSEECRSFFQKLAVCPGGWLIKGDRCYYSWGTWAHGGYPLWASQNAFFKRVLIRNRSFGKCFFSRSAVDILISHHHGKHLLAASSHELHEHECMLDPMMIWSVAKKGYAQNEIGKTIRCLRKVFRNPIANHKILIGKHSENSMVNIRFLCD